ncbi:MAG: polysaccharide deacetylase family protein [Candidatus Krumholzibacteriales bacterium]
MFHSAGLRDLEWRSSHISEPLDILKAKFDVIRDEGYRTLFMKEAAEHSGDRRDKLIHLTFDDGYLDNWVHIFPLLREYGFKATIFVSAEFIDPGESIREQKHIYEREHDPVGCCAGFLSFREMKEMEASGLVEIQSHSLTHTWYFNGPEIVDFWHPGAATEAGGPVWMLWNRFPDRKPFYLLEASELENRIPYGSPIYEHGKSLETVRYIPEEKELSRRLIQLAGQEGGRIFQKRDWHGELQRLVGEYRDKYGIEGRYESRDEYLKRIRFELEESKRIIENGLGHSIEGICWPGGGVNEECFKLAGEAGYKYFTLPPNITLPEIINYAEGIIKRISSPQDLRLKNRYLGYHSRSDFRHYLRSKNGYLISGLLFRLGKVKNLFRPGSGRKVRNS